MKSLIINADDLGISDAINEAVRQCYLRNVITGVSISACGNRFIEAAGMLRDMGKPEVGVHITLTGAFSPCAEDPSRIRSLLTDQEKFVDDYMSFAMRYFTRGISMQEVSLEISNQIRKIKEAGLVITHFDSHEHIHMFPGVLKVTLDLAEEFKVPYIRLPRESICAAGKRFSPKNLVRHMVLKFFIPGARCVLSQRNLCFNSSFWGHFHSGDIDDEIFCFFIDKMKDGINEIAFHPEENARVEMDTLLNGKWNGLAQEKGIRLITHNEAARPAEG